MSTFSSRAHLDSLPESTSVGRRCGDTDDEGAGEHLAREMQDLWRRGERPLAEDFLDRCPDLWRQPESAVDVVYEEFCLRAQAGEQDAADSVLCRFPQWRTQLEAMIDFHRLLQAAAVCQFPEVGETLGGFRLLAELGRGGRGRVFLAAQASLGDRPVVLKITPRDGAEHISLARVQHTHIVPIYSALDDAARDMRMLCMPYFGGATLAGLLEELADVPVAQRSGQLLVDVLDQLQPRPPEALSVSGPARQFITGAGYVESVCWISACLADALQYAHERGLVHLDVKPSNILLAADCQPMLLDFHAARTPIRSGQPVAEALGGTPAYMPTEQRAALAAASAGRDASEAVDARADVYSLGAVLYELLGGHGLYVAGHSPPLLEISGAVSVGLSDIVTRCLEVRPCDRYPNAASLAGDLRHHLADLPLVGAGNRSLGERWRKLRRRRSHALRIAAMLAVVVAAATLVVALVGLQMRNRLAEAQHALEEGQAQLHVNRHAQAVETFARGYSSMAGLPFRPDLARQLQDQLTIARRRLATQELHELADQIRVLYAVQPVDPAALRLLVTAGQGFWNKRTALVESLDAAHSPEVAADLLDVAIFWADLQVRLAAPHDADAARSSALRVLDEAEAMFGKSRVVTYQRRILSADTSLKSGPFRDPTIHADRGRSPHSAWEHYALGRAFLAANDLPTAAAELAAALELDPSGKWPNFYGGICAYRQGRYDDAVAAFSVCIGAAPDSAGCFYNRALAFTALHRVDRALDDYHRAIELDPALSAALLNRGMLHYELKQYAAALADLRLAIQQGADPAIGHYDLALVHLAVNDLAAARSEIQSALDHEPSRELAVQLDQIRRQLASNR